MNIILSSMVLLESIPIRKLFLTMQTLKLEISMEKVYEKVILISPPVKDKEKEQSRPEGDGG